MPNIKSAKKRVKVIETKTLRNKMIKSDLRKALKAAKTAEGDAQNEAVKAAIVKVDKACAKGILHKNNAARKKSQLASLIK